MNNKWLIIIIPVLMWASYMAIPRGIRNNNPGNIKHGDNWQGMTTPQTDKTFVQFKSAKYGIRAITRILKTYKNHGIEYLVDIIYRWAPPAENDTRAYIESVEKSTGKFANERITENDYPQIIAAIIKHENGINPYSRKTIEEGIALA